MRSSTVLLAFTASVIGLPYQKDEGLFDVQSPPEEFLASNDLQDLYSDDKIADNPTDGKYFFNVFFQYSIYSWLIFH